MFITVTSIHYEHEALTDMIVYLYGEREGTMCTRWSTECTSGTEAFMMCMCSIGELEIEGRFGQQWVDVTPWVCALRLNICRHNPPTTLLM